MESCQLSAFTVQQLSIWTRCDFRGAIDEVFGRWADVWELLRLWFLVLIQISLNFRIQRRAYRMTTAARIDWKAVCISCVGTNIMWRTIVMTHFNWIWVENKFIGNIVRKMVECWTWSSREEYIWWSPVERGVLPATQDQVQSKINKFRQMKRALFARCQIRRIVFH